MNSRALVPARPAACKSQSKLICELEIWPKPLFLRAEPAKIQKYKTAVFKAADLGSNPSRSVSEKFEKSAILEPKSNFEAKNP